MSRKLAGGLFLENKWIEINIHVRDGSQMNRTLLTDVKEFVSKCKKEYHLKRWHFLRELCPLSESQIPEIRLRLNAPAEEIPRIRESAVSSLSQVSDPELHFGAHGKPGEYDGESFTFGERGWPIFAEFLQSGSETALNFLEMEPQDNSERSTASYMERFVHLLLNQLDAPHHISLQVSLFVPLDNQRG
jgi:hypothetical protein